MIELMDVTKSYNGTVKAVDNLTLTVRGGEIFGFLGPNGAGKTTTIKMITGIIQPDKGTIRINGRTYPNRRLKRRSSLATFRIVRICFYGSRGWNI